MKTISALEVRAKFGQVLDEAAAGEQIVVERAGQPVAAIVPLSALAALDPDAILARRRAALDDLRRTGSRLREQLGSVDSAELVRQGRREREDRSR